MDRGEPQIRIETVTGDLLEQDVDALVNPWNRNYVPRLLLLPAGVSGALKKASGPAPWRELAKAGVLDIGQVVITNGGKLKADLIHVAGINALWRSTDSSVATSSRNVVQRAWSAGYRSIAMPLIGSGSGGMAQAKAGQLIRESLVGFENPEGTMTVRIVTRG